MTQYHFTERDIRRFWSKVDKGAPDGCWIWGGSLVKQGYGLMAIQIAPYLTKRISAHRIAWQLTNGHIPDGLFVCHRCDTPACVNPSHLFLGTNTDNMRDMVEKGRKASCRWENNGNAKLTASDVEYIRTHYRPKHREFSQVALARKFGVSRHAIQDIISRRRWV